MTHENNGQTDQNLPRTADRLRRERPTASPLRLDEIKRDVMRKTTRARQPRLATSLRRRVMALTLFVMLFGISTSNAAASLLSWVSGGSLGSNTLGYGKQTSGMQFFFGSFSVGGDSSDDAGHETYCPDDKGSDDGDGSSSDDSDGDRSYSTTTGGGDGSDDGDKSSGDQSSTDRDDCETDDESSDKSSDDNDRSSGDDSDGDKESSDDGDGSSNDNSDGDSKSDDGDRSSGDNSDWSDDNDGSSDDQSD